MTVRLEKLAVDLVANGQRFKAELAASQTSAEKWGRGVKSAISLGTGALVGAGAAASALTVKTIRLADEIAKNSKASGVGAETYQAWEFAASQAGVSNDKFSVSLERATKRIGEAARGFGGAKKTLDDYGISVFDARGNLRTTEDVIREFSDRLKDMGSAAERTAAITALFGREGIRMGLVFGQGADALKQFEDKARTLGLVIDQGVLQQAEAANDQLDIMQRVIKAQLIGAFSNLFPTVVSIGNSFAAAAPKVLEFTDAVLGLAFGTEKAQIKTSIDIAKTRIEALKVSLNQIGNAEVAATDDFSRSRLARARRNAEREIRAQKVIIEKQTKSLAEFEASIKKRSADLLDPSKLLFEGEGGGGAGGSGRITGKTFEELQADAAERANARRFESLSDYSANYIELTQTLIDKDKDRTEKAIEAERALRDAKISVAEDIFGTLGNLAKEDSKAQRVLFAAQKAAALSRSIIALQEAIARANAIGFPANIPAIAQAVAVGTGAISTIQGVSLQGVAHAGLSNVPREGTYLLNKDERVVAPEQNRDLTNFLRGGGSQGGIIVQYNQAPGGNVEQSFREERTADGQLMLIIDERVRRVVGGDVGSGRGLATQIEQTYNLKRRGAR